MMKVTRNLLFDVTLPNTTGYGSVVSNVGKVRFYGVDLAISSVNISPYRIFRNPSWPGPGNAHGWPCRSAYGICQKP